MKIKTTVYVYYVKWTFQDNGEWKVYSCKLDDDSKRAFVHEQVIELEVPDNFDPRAQQIAALEAQKQKAMSDYNDTVMDINTRISKLQALEYTP
jgi:hypothetical protein